MGAGGGQGQVGEEDEEALLLTRSNPPVAGGGDWEVSRVVGRLENRKTRSTSVDAVGRLATSGGGGALGVRGRVHLG